MVTCIARRWTGGGSGGAAGLLNQHIDCGCVVLVLCTDITMPEQCNQLTATKTTYNNPLRRMTCSALRLLTVENIYSFLSARVITSAGPQSTAHALQPNHSQSHAHDYYSSCTNGKTHRENHHASLLRH